ncbi:MAG: rubrerythrin family protein [Patescibacteria group bacterium]
METPKNILKAIAGESMARNKYTYFASQAKKEGYEQISAIFIETADNEKEHAKRLMKLLSGPTESSLEKFDFPVVGTTAENLGVAAAGENFEHTKMYPEFAKTAKEEGQDEAAKVFTEIGEVEEEHENRYLRLKENVERGLVFKRDEEVEWKCRNCGYVHKGTEAPEVCPACAHPQAHYELLTRPY